MRLRIPCIWRLATGKTALWVEDGIPHSSHKGDERPFSFPAAAAHAMGWVLR
ncbi:MAG: hypothetical protein QXD47_08490 [Candidatus Caldarchaeum sp.]